MKHEHTTVLVGDVLAGRVGGARQRLRLPVGELERVKREAVLSGAGSTSEFVRLVLERAASGRTIARAAEQAGLARDVWVAVVVREAAAISHLRADLQRAVHGSCVEDGDGW